ncbi:signal transduction histidine kinase [Anaerobacterium chartisolvens]|uniref:histidine kinase n=1 Tax=Anaerobacterium chartisolvens TaxID=1297424 RepID=A0A369AWL9_9FIRM|nr:HAMP domain-containing sensor histidine kinase [Anaerobacterium chartisolvens]RCX12738.1 signal transduction histidine kinase [Anaerobacterium chartisolvens]
MKSNSITWKIFRYNMAAIIMLIALITIVFNIAARVYIENDAARQLNTIALRAEYTALQKGSDFFPEQGMLSPPPGSSDSASKGNDDFFKFYFMLDRSLKQTLSVLNADYLLFDSDKNLINSSSEGYFDIPEILLAKIMRELNDSSVSDDGKHLKFDLLGTEYIAVAKPVSHKNTFGLGWIIIYSSLQKVNHLQYMINAMLLSILILSSLAVAIFSFISAKKISEPFLYLSRHIGSIAERNFGTKINVPIYSELEQFINSINIMSEKIEKYDNVQKTFLQNVSHEFRTPLMSIQSYAEGIKYDVVEAGTATNIIIDESKHLAHLVDDLMYLSRLDTLEENYHFTNLNFNDLINNCIERMNGIAINNNIQILCGCSSEKVEIMADHEKLSRAITNIISNCIRYAGSKVEIEFKSTEHSKLILLIWDDGHGFASEDLPNIFERFYKGKKGNFGLGLAIAKNVIEKHKGKVTAQNSESGALFIIELPLL